MAAITLSSSALSFFGETTSCRFFVLTMGRIAVGFVSSADGFASSISLGGEAGKKGDFEVGLSVGERITLSVCESGDLTGVGVLVGVMTGVLEASSRFISGSSVTGVLLIVGE